jgi:hypothetical protein
MPTARPPTMFTSATTKLAIVSPLTNFIAPSSEP